MADTPKTLGEKLRSILTPRIILMFLMGFSSGLPLLLIGATLKIWFRRSEMDLTTIGLFSLVGLPYAFKFAWAPLLDRFVLPLGRRRGWIVASQIAIALCLYAMSGFDPKTSPGQMAGLAFMIAFFSATQDTALDAYRREYLRTLEFGFGTSIFITGYRIGMMTANAGALFLTGLGNFTFPMVYMIMASMMGVGLLTTLIAPEPKVEVTPPQSLAKAFYEPLVEYFSRPGSLMILVFILLYKIGDNMAAEMTGPLYVDLGFTDAEIGAIAKVFGVWSTILGGVVGGVILVQLGVIRSLWVFGVLQALSTAGFAWLGRDIPTPEMLEAIKQGTAHADRVGLACVITFENFTAGMGMSAFATFMASLTNKKFSATQYALLSSLMAVPRIFAGAPTGFMAKHMGWLGFYITCAVIAIPGMLMLLWVSKIYRETEQANLSSEDSQDAEPLKP